MRNETINDSNEKQYSENMRINLKFVIFEGRFDRGGMLLIIESEIKSEIKNGFTLRQRTAMTLAMVWTSWVLLIFDGLEKSLLSVTIQGVVVGDGRLEGRD